jgi:hypothetical protein
MRKVDLEVLATVLVPVKVLLDVTVRADDDANIEQAVFRHAQGRKYSKADIEDISVSKIVNIGTEPVNESTSHDVDFALSEVLNQVVECGKFRVVDISVLDAR